MKGLKEHHILPFNLHEAVTIVVLPQKINVMLQVRDKVLKFVTKLVILVIPKKTLQERFDRKNISVMRKLIGECA